MKERWFRSAAALMLVMALCVGGFAPFMRYAYADGNQGGAIAVTLVSPADGAAVSGEQKLIFSAGQAIVPVSGKQIAVTVDGIGYYADAASGTPVSYQSQGVWQVEYAVGAFATAPAEATGAVALALSAGKTYLVTAEAGAFADASGNVSGAVAAQFATANETDTKLVLYTPSDGAFSLKKTEDGSAVPSGSAVPAGTTLRLDPLTLEGYAIAATALAGGVETPIPDPSSITINQDTTITITATRVDLTGTATISGEAKVGGTLTGALESGNNTTSDHLTYTWKRGDTTLGTGGTYAVVDGDAGATITLTVTSSLFSGSVVSQPTAEVTRPAAAAPSAPTMATVTQTGITLNAVEGYEYARDDGAWQDSPEFTGLNPATTYRFRQRVKAAGSQPASEASPVAEISTQAPPAPSALSGTLSMGGNAAIGETLTVSLLNSNNTGTLSYAWKRGETLLANTQSYQVTAADLGSQLTAVVTSSVETGALSLLSATVVKSGGIAAPAAPTLLASTSNSISLTAFEGYEYSQNGTVWQDSPTFLNLNAGTTYTFYQRVKETPGAQASPTSPAAQYATVAAVSGTITVDGEARVGRTLTASILGAGGAGAWSYTWKRGTVPVGAGQSYTVTAADIGSQLTVEATSSGQTGTLARVIGVVQRSSYTGAAPSAPTRQSRTTSSVTLVAESGYEYSRDGSTWQDSSTFKNLSDGKTYTFYRRIKATDTTEASPASEGLRVATLVDESDSSGESGGSSSSGSSSGSGSSSSGSSSGSANATLYSYTLTSDNTRILYSTLESLIRGNQQQDVTIKGANTEFVFLKGTMKAVSGQLWYDFGTTVGGCVHEQYAKEIAGDKFVQIIHFNYEGQLPASANIRILLGTQYAGQTLYYYKLNAAAKTLSYMQTAVCDTNGWITVVQSSCSDYVFLNATIDAPVASASPSPSASPNPSPTSSAGGALVTEPAGAGGNGVGLGGWALILIIVAALLLIGGGIWLQAKNRKRRYDDYDDYADYDDDPDDYDDRDDDDTDINLF